MFAKSIVLWLIHTLHWHLLNLSVRVIHHVSLVLSILLIELWLLELRILVLHLHMWLVWRLGLRDVIHIWIHSLNSILLLLDCKGLELMLRLISWDRLNNLGLMNLLHVKLLLVWRRRYHIHSLKLRSWRLHLNTCTTLRSANNLNRCIL